MATRILRDKQKLCIINNDKIIKTIDSGIAIALGAGDITYQIRGEK